MCFDVPIWWCLVADALFCGIPLCLIGLLIVAVGVGISQALRRNQAEAPSPPQQEPDRPDTD